ncbi:uncharacterized protein LOC121731589 [Aricia agestis]|uniref:uncharacterized protein LOC121731589 n=1 Tax=Aricia agestis TaxID=91739 RepID=UPI001C205A17|nr:uncharacterized protein LOC121731589 [Aricia agestis]
MYRNIYIFTSILCAYVDSLSFDQRQNGDFNVQVDVKDVQIIAVLTGDKEEYVDYDYAYDYSQLTIKPQNRTTPRPGSTTPLISENLANLSDSTTVAATVYEETNGTAYDMKNTTLLEENSTVSESEAVTSTTTRFVMEGASPAPTTLSDPKVNTTLTTSPSPDVPICRKGFVVNSNKECQPKSNTTENALIKLVKLSQKLKLRRENKSNNN